MEGWREKEGGVETERREREESESIESTRTGVRGEGRGRGRNIIRVSRCMHGTRVLAATTRVAIQRERVSERERDTHTRPKRGREEETKEREVTLLGGFSCRLSATTRGVTPSSSRCPSPSSSLLTASSCTRPLARSPSLSPVAARVSFNPRFSPVPRRINATLSPITLQRTLFVRRISGVDCPAEARSSYAPNE